ncbi:hypothetical protein K2173_027262 [Erythroxylum novogranatense]|uniref:Synaptonemal complex protein 1-like n=1 Tax=Erythroxylum novogranatense TaxID=1862640 RepID=A0AAV8U141_9ROSI|nr:hypothetical protein K2173_027262 [Erythroxylum novogranatense]
MQNIGSRSMRSFDQFKSFSGSAKNFSFSSRSSSDSISMGNFTNLKIAAEKLVKEQASVKADLEMANSKLKKSMECVHALEEKLQNAFNENAKLKVKQKEDEKLWKGLESKFSSTKILCDQLTETLQHLAGQVQNAEKDKEFFEEKLSTSSNAIDNLNQELNFLSEKLGSAENIIRTREKELEELRVEKEESNKIYLEEKCLTTKLLEEKDAMLKDFEAAIETNRVSIESLNSKLKEVHLTLRLKEDDIKRLMTIRENLEKTKSDLESSNNDLADNLALSIEKIKTLESFVHVLATQLIELDRKSWTFSEKFDQLNSLYDGCFKLVQHEQDMVAKHAKKEYKELHDKLLCATSEKQSLQSVNLGLNNKIIELQKAQETAKTQLSEECRLAGERIQVLESEAAALMSKKNETEILVSKLERTIDAFSENSRLSEIKMQDLLSQISALEMKNKANVEKLEAEIQKTSEQMDTSRKETEKYKQHKDSLEKQVAEFQGIIEEKEKLVLQHKEKATKLNDQMNEKQALLTAAESRLLETKKQHDVMLAGKQLELSRHLKELSQRNDQAINEIKNKFEMEKNDIVNMEMEKADKIVLEIERKCDQKLAECKEESRKTLMSIQEENAALVLRIQQEHEKMEMSLRDQHNEDLKRAQLHTENELRERIKQLQDEHEVQIRALRCEHEYEYRRLLEQLDLQKFKEDRQRALLQLQWKVMSDKPQVDQEANSKKDYSISSIKMRDPSDCRRSRRIFVRKGNGDQGKQFARGGQTPVPNILNKVENVNTGSVSSIPTHHKKVTRREYEIETTNGRTVTKRRKTKSTVMFEDPRKQEKRITPRVVTPKTTGKGIKGGVRSHPSNIGDLFSEGSLNPYVDDPYAFD